MRCLVLILFAAAVAAESFPVLTVTYGGAGPAPTAPVAQWWGEAVDDAAAWLGQGAEPAISGQATVAGCRGLRLVGIGVVGGQSGPTPWAAGWWQDAPAVLTGALRVAAADWPGYEVREADGRLHLAAPGIVTVGDEAAPAGWRVTLHGGALRHALAAVVPAEDLQPWQGLLGAATRADVVAGVEPDGRAWITSGLPARWFAPADAGLAARLPANALAMATVGIDGAALAADFLAIEGPLPEDIDDLLQAAGTDLAGFAHALTGTWAFALTGPQQGIACLPRSAPLDRLIAKATKGAIIADSVPVALDDLVIARTERCWLVADRAQRISDFIAAAAQPAPVVAETVGWARVHEGTALALAQMPVELLAQWPLPRRLLGWPEATENLARQLGVAVPPRSWTTALGALAGTGEHRIDLRPDHGRLRADLHGPLLPWLVPGAALRWFADHAQDLRGRARLRRQIEAWRAADIGALPEDLATLVPEVPVEDIARETALCFALAVGPMPPSGEDPWQHARNEYLPIARPSPTPWLDHLDTLLAASAPLASPGRPTASAVSLRLAESAGAIGPGMTNPHVQAASRLARAGRILAALADPGGVELADRALALVSEPLSMTADQVRQNVRGQRDDAWLASAITGSIAPARVAAWAAEPPPVADPRCWQGERLLRGWGAAAWLDLPTAPPTQPLWRLLAAPAIWQPHVVRAHAAADHAALAELILHWERSEGLPLGWVPPQSPLALEAIQTLLPMRASTQRAVVRHVLVRLAWRLHQLAQAGTLPADAAAATAAAGPLTVPWGTVLLPLAYTRHGSGFRLAVDTSGERPAQVDEADWRRMRALKAPPATQRLLLGPNAVVISPRREAAPAVGEEP